MITKTHLLSTFDKLPENLTIDQVIDHIIFVEKVQKCLEDSENGITAAARAEMLPIMVPDLVAPSAEIRAMTYAVADSLHQVKEIFELTLLGES